MLKRVTLFCGHYGSGKTNIAVNMAMDLRRRKERVAVADLDIVNPYFRTKDSSDDFSHAGIRLICSSFANSNLDLPAMPQDLYAITDDKNLSVILDIGGDDRGALALGRIAPAVMQENDYEMLMVINGRRPLTPDAESTVEVMREIECACGIGFTGIINNTNLGEETTADVVLGSIPYAEATAKLSGLPLVMTTVEESLFDELKWKIGDLFPLKLQNKL